MGRKYLLVAVFERDRDEDLRVAQSDKEFMKGKETLNDSQLLIELFRDEVERGMRMVAHDPDFLVLSGPVEGEIDNTHREWAQDNYGPEQKGEVKGGE